MRIVYRYVAVSAGAGFIPIIGLDVAILAGIHVSLIKRLCEHYDVEFSEHTARNLLIAVVGSIIPGTAGSLLSSKVLGALPRAIHPFGGMLMSASSAAFSFGIGKLFVRHFESGGTLLSFDPARLHDLRDRPAAHRKTSAVPATSR